MADIKTDTSPLFLRDEDLRQGIELLFFAYRDFTTDADLILSHYGFGRAHHRVIYFVGRNPGLSVSELLRILQITKQSLSRVLRELVDQDFIIQAANPDDRRQRLMSLTGKGVALERELTGLQRTRLARAYRTAGAESVSGFRKVLLGLLDPQEREIIGAALARRGNSDNAH